MAERTATILFNAKDNTKQAVDSVKGNVKDLNKVAADLGSAVAAGFATKQIIDFGKALFSASAEGETALVQFQNVMKNIPGTTEELIRSFQDAGAAAVRFGVDDETATLSLSYFYQRTQDATAALDLHNLALNLAATGLGTYTDASDAIIQALSGNTRGLRQFRIEMVEGESVARTLERAYKSTFGSANDSLKTARVTMAAFTETTDNLKQQLGDTFREAVLPFIRGLSAVMDWFLGLSPTVQKFIGWVIGLTIAFAGLTAAVIAITGAFFALTAAAAALSISLLPLVGIIGAVVAVAGVLGFTLYQLGKSTDTTKGSIGAATPTVDQFGKTLVGVKGGALDISDAMKKMGADAADTAKKIKALRDEMEKTRKEGMAEEADLNRNAAEEIVSQERKVTEISQDLEEKRAQLKRAARDELTGEQKRQLKQEIDDLEYNLERETDALRRFGVNRMNLQKEYEEAERRARLTEFERRMEDIAIRKKEAAERLKEKLADQAAELKALMAHHNSIRVQERALTTSVQAEQKTQLDGWMNVQRARVSAMSGSTPSSNIKSNLSVPTPFLTPSSHGLSAMPRALGGPVNAGSLYLVGERGPEFFKPNNSGTIIPNAGGTTVNIINPVMLDDTYIDKVGQQIVRILGRDLRY